MVQSKLLACFMVIKLQDLKSLWLQHDVVGVTHMTSREESGEEEEWIERSDGERDARGLL